MPHLVLALLLAPAAPAAPRTLPLPAARAAAPLDEAGPVDEAERLLRARRPQAASLLLHEALVAGTLDPDEADRARVALGRALEALDLPLAASDAYRRVVLAGGDTPAFAVALARLVALAGQTGDATELRDLVADLPPDRFPPGARDTLSYQQAVRRYEEGDLSGALALLDPVDPGAPEGPRARFLQGVIHNRQGRLKSAVRDFRAVYQADPAAELADRAVLNIARTYYALGRFEEADRTDSLVDRDGPLWPEALFEQAWAEFMVGDTERSLGRLLTLRSGFFAEDAYLPEAPLLEALAAFNHCDHAEAEARMRAFEARYGPMEAELAARVAAGPDGGWSRWYGPEGEAETTLPKAFFAHLLEDADQAGAARRLALLDAEAARLDQQRPAWRAALGPDLQAALAADRARTLTRADRILHGGVVREQAVLDDLLARAELVRFEALDAQRVAWEHRLDPAPTPSDREVGRVWFGPSVETVDWPFNGEFWLDELGRYRVTSPELCQ